LGEVVGSNGRRGEEWSGDEVVGGEEKRCSQKGGGRDDIEK
jgi:hypothetical protein